MGLKADKVFDMKMDFELGTMTKSGIAKKHDVSRVTLNKHAKDGEWVYQRAFLEAASKAEEKMLNNLTERNHELMEGLTTEYLDNLEKYRGLAMIPYYTLQNKLDEGDGSNLDKADIEKMFALAKLTKFAIETICTAHTGVRVGLGMDKDQEIRKAREIHNEERNSQLVDPLEGLTSEQIKQELNQLKSRSVEKIILEKKEM